MKSRSEEGVSQLVEAQLRLERDDEARGVQLGDVVRFGPLKDVDKVLGHGVEGVEVVTGAKENADGPGSLRSQGFDGKSAVKLPQSHGVICRASG